MKNRNKVAQINITPLVDVMLVLLVIFMVATPMMHVEVDVNLPSIHTSRNDEEVEEKALRIFIYSQKIMIKSEKNEETVDKAALKIHLKSIDKNSSILIYADKKLRYEEVFEILQVFKDSGFYKVSLVGFKK